jgi:hypothetical protein
MSCRHQPLAGDTGQHTYQIDERDCDVSAWTNVRSALRTRRVLVGT